MAFWMAAVSPLRSDSKTRKSLTDCSMEAPVGAVGESGEAWGLVAEGEAGLLAASRVLPVCTLDMLALRCARCFVEALRWWPGRCCECECEWEDCDCEATEAEELAAMLPSAVVSWAAGSFLDETRPRRFLTLADFERLCL